MTYRILDIEASAAFSPVELSPSEDGVGVLVRWRGTPVCFFLEPLESGLRLPGPRLETLVGRRAGIGITRGALREELWDDPPARPLDLTVAVCTRDRPQWLRACLSSLASLEDGTRPTVLVVDNAPSTAATRELVDDMPGVRYVLEPVPGLDVARNRALKETRTAYIAFVDDDVVVDASWATGLSRAWVESPEAAAVTGLVLPYELQTPAQLLFERRGGFRRGTHSRRFAAGSGYRSNHPFGTGGFGTGANMAFRTEALRALGGFDPALDTGPPLPGGGDLDMFYRVLASGQVLAYTPAAVVWHRHRRTMAELRRQYWTWGSGYLAFLHRTWRTEPARRPEVARAAAWWLRRELRTTYRSLRGRDPAPPPVAAATLVGGVSTAVWKYPWSVRRPRHRSEGRA